MRWMGRSQGTTTADLSFTYESIGKSGVIDQTLSIRNRGSSAVTLRLSFTPLDADGHDLRGLTVTSAYGTEAGRHIIPAKFTDIDVLAFHGPDFRDVADVRVEVEQVEEVPFPAKIREVVLTDRIDRRGNEVGPGSEYAHVRLTNVNREPVTVRVALVEYENPPPGMPQQAVDVQELGGLITVPGQGVTTIPGPTTFPDAFVSVKAYFSR